MKILLTILLLIAPCYALDSLIPALIEVESNGNDQAIGDNGKAFGPLQIWDICVQDVNRIYNVGYEHEQMFNRGHAIDVCVLYLLHWGAKYKLKTGKQPSYEVLARIWNGGPMGYKNPKTIGYWNKVNKALTKK
jgi:hypothetical protein